LVETPKETRNKLLNKINWNICHIKMHWIFYIKNYGIKMRRKNSDLTVMIIGNCINSNGLQYHIQ